MAEHCIGKNGTLTCSGCWKTATWVGSGQERGLQWVWAAAKAVWPLAQSPVKLLLSSCSWMALAFREKKKKGWLNSNPKYRSPLRPCVYIPKYCIKTKCFLLLPGEKLFMFWSKEVSLERRKEMCSSCYKFQLSPISGFLFYEVQPLHARNDTWPSLCWPKRSAGHCWNALSHLFSHTLVCCLLVDK